jgi:ectoine hydroxylase-related dioxygenase (phytanoyl-CoA dioxygenase family)
VREVPASRHRTGLREPEEKPEVQQDPETVDTHRIANLADQVRVDGYCLLGTILGPAQVASMRQQFLELLEAKQRSESFNRGPNRFQMYLPWQLPFADPDLFECDQALAVMEAVMGPDLALQYFASDTPMPGSDYQRVHSDTRLLFPECAHSLPAYGMVLNVPLVDCTEENGSLEFWPGGTHLVPRDVDREGLAVGMRSCRANLQAGTALLRDLRMWHRGTPNRSHAPRPHLALVYTRPWYRFEQQVPELERAEFDKLSPRAQRLLRFARVLG